MLNLNKWQWAGLAFCLVFALSRALIHQNPIPVAPTDKIDKVVYVYEKDSTPVPSAVRAGLDELNSQGIEATEHEEDTTDGTDNVPEQYKVAVEATQKAGLPSLVATAKAKVVKVVKNPQTKEQVLEVVK